MGCGSSKNADATELTQNSRPTGASAAQQQTAPVQRNGQAPVGAGGGHVEKPRRHPENPVVYFDVAIGGMSIPENLWSWLGGCV